MLTSAERRSDSLCEQIVFAVADREGVDPLDLVPLYDAIDPCLWYSLFEPLSENADYAPTPCSFTYHGYEVTVDGNSVQVSERPTGQESEVLSLR